MNGNSIMISWHVKRIQPSDDSMNHEMMIELQFIAEFNVYLCNPNPKLKSKTNKRIIDVSVFL